MGGCSPDGKHKRRVRFRTRRLVYQIFRKDHFPASVSQYRQR